MAEASVAVQATLEAEIRENDVLQAATRTVCEALAVEGVSRVAPSGAAWLH